MRGDCIPMYDSKKIKARFDLKKFTSAGDVSLGDEVEITVRGKVVNLRGPEESMYEDHKGKTKTSTYPGSMEIDVSTMKVVSKGEFGDSED